MDINGFTAQLWDHRLGIYGGINNVLQYVCLCVSDT